MSVPMSFMFFDLNSCDRIMRGFRTTREGRRDLRVSAGGQWYILGRCYDVLLWLRYSERDGNSARNMRTTRTRTRDGSETHAARERMYESTHTYGHTHTHTRRKPQIFDFYTLFTRERVVETVERYE